MPTTTNWPNDYDDLPKPDENTLQDDPDFYHDELHTQVANTIEAMQAQLGKAGATNLSTIVAKVAKGGLYSAENKQGATLAAGLVLATHASGTGIVKADAIGVAKRAVGFLCASTLNAIAGDVQTDGILTLADWTAVIGAASLTRGPYFLDASAPGTMTQLPSSTPGNIVQELGNAISTTEFDISIQSPILM